MSTRIIIILGLLTLGLVGGDPFLAELKRGELHIPPGQSFEAIIEIQVPEGHYLYEDELDVDFLSLEGVHIDDILFPEPVTKFDPFRDEEINVYDSDVEITIRGHVPKGLSPGQRELTIRVSYRGCSGEECFAPQEKDLVVILGADSKVVETDKREAIGIVPLSLLAGFFALCIVLAALLQRRRARGKRG